MIIYVGICSRLLSAESYQKRTQHEYSQQRTDGEQNDSSKWLAGGAAALFGISLYYWKGKRKEKQMYRHIKFNVISENKHLVNAKASVDARKFHEEVRKDLPTYTMDEVCKHDAAPSIWVTYGIGVYDITRFVPEHPGSDKVMLAAGNAIDPFWHVYQQHNTTEVLQLLESFRVGNLDASERVSTSDMEDPWSNEPKRHPVLKPASERPFNAEPPSHLLIDSYLTPKSVTLLINCIILLIESFFQRILLCTQSLACAHRGHRYL